MDTKAVEVKTLLVKARDLLSDPKRWIKGNYARRYTTPTGEIVTGFCSIGALYETCDSNRLGFFDDAETALGRAVKGMGVTSGSIPYFNDHPNTTHKDVLAAFDKAITTTAAQIAASDTEEN